MVQRKNVMIFFFFIFHFFLIHFYVWCKRLVCMHDMNYWHTWIKAAVMTLKLRMNIFIFSKPLSLAIIKNIIQIIIQYKKWIKRIGYGKCPPKWPTALSFSTLNISNLGIYVLTMGQSQIQSLITRWSLQFLKKLNKCNLIVIGSGVILAQISTLNLRILNLDWVFIDQHKELPVNDGNFFPKPKKIDFAPNSQSCTCCFSQEE